VGYFELKLHKYILGTPETNITSCKKGHNRCPLMSSDMSGPFYNYLIHIHSFKHSISLRSYNDILMVLSSK